MVWKQPPSAEYQRELKARRLGAGLCPRCGHARDRPERKLCARCRAYATSQDRKRGKGWLKDSGICYRCKLRPAADGYKSCAQCRTGIIANHKAVNQSYQQRLRLAALERYGPSCRCCGEPHTAFLAIDHIDGGGNAHRRAIGRRSIFQWLRDNGYPSGFQVLCHNCNLAKQFYGSCPHQSAPTE
jgi:hypothetical protein